MKYHAQRRKVEGGHKIVNTTQTRPTQTRTLTGIKSRSQIKPSVKFQGRLAPILPQYFQISAFPLNSILRRPGCSDSARITSVELPLEPVDTACQRKNSERTEPVLGESEKIDIAVVCRRWLPHWDVGRTAQTGFGRRQPWSDPRGDNQASENPCPVPPSRSCGPFFFTPTLDFFAKFPVCANIHAIKVEICGISTTLWADKNVVATHSALSL
ncbi:hypothetical protein C8R43DRAFT_951680 [Mycena crocata]|nr:hypothetical protein C8R43DRAFT_951680 [Mycena crocata]